MTGSWRSLQAAGSRLFSTRRAEESLGAADTSVCATTSAYAATGGTSVFRNSCATRKPRLYCSVKSAPLYAG